VFELRVKTPAADLETFFERLRAAGLECHATDEDVVRVFVPGEGGARDVFAGGRRARAGPPPACERAHARGRLHARGGRE
jgi:hypothetical protein